MNTLFDIKRDYNDDELENSKYLILYSFLTPRNRE